MAVLTLCSVAGSPGTTTLAIGLALSWQRSVILVDADPGAYQAVLAGFLRGQIRTSKGLQRVAEAHRDRRPLAEVTHDQTMPLTEEGMHSRRLLPGFARPANAALFAPVWPDLVEAFFSYESAGIDVIVDIGRLDAHGLPQSLLQRSDVIGLVTQSSLRSVAGARNYAGMLSEQVRSAGGDQNTGLIMIGENQPYGRREIGRLLQLPVITAVADDPRSAAALSNGSRRSRKFDQAPLAKSLRQSCGDLRGWIDRRRVRLGWPGHDGSVGDAADHGVDQLRAPAEAPVGRLVRDSGSAG